MQRERPLLHSIVMCDHVYRDAGSGKFYLLGTFTNMMVREFPGISPQIGFYISASHWITEQHLNIHVVKESIDVIVKMPGILVPKQEHNVKIEFGGNLPPFPIKEAGRYGIQVLAGLELIHEFPFQVNGLPGSIGG